MNVSREITRSMNAPESEIVELLTFIETTGDRGHIRALKKFQGISEIDTSSKFFFGLEKNNGQRGITHCLKSAVGQELTIPSEIRKSIKR
jgi:hypothetical protein